MLKCIVTFVCGGTSFCFIPNSRIRRSCYRHRRLYVSSYISNLACRTCDNVAVVLHHWNDRPATKYVREAGLELQF